MLNRVESLKSSVEERASGCHLLYGKTKNRGAGIIDVGLDTKSRWIHLETNKSYKANRGSISRGWQ